MEVTRFALKYAPRTLVVEYRKEGKSFVTKITIKNTMVSCKYSPMRISSHIFGIIGAICIAKEASEEIRAFART